MEHTYSGTSASTHEVMEPHILGLESSTSDLQIVFSAPCHSSA